MPHFTKEDLNVIKTCFEKNGWHGKRLVSEFPEKGWSPRSVNKAIRRLTAQGSVSGKKEKKHPNKKNCNKKEKQKKGLRKSVEKKGDSQVDKTR